MHVLYNVYLDTEIPWGLTEKLYKEFQLHIRKNELKSLALGL